MLNDTADSKSACDRLLCASDAWLQLLAVLKGLKLVMQARCSMGTISKQDHQQQSDLCSELTQCKAVLNLFHALSRQSVAFILEIMQTAGKQCLGLREVAAPILGIELSPDRHPVTLNAHALQPCCDPLCAGRNMCWGLNFQIKPHDVMASQSCIGWQETISY